MEEAYTKQEAELARQSLERRAGRPYVTEKRIVGLPEYRGEPHFADERSGRGWLLAIAVDSLLWIVAIWLLGWWAVPLVVVLVALLLWWMRKG